MSAPELTALRLADPPPRWAALGFAVAERRLDLGGVRIELGARGRGIMGWTLRGIDPGLEDIDGLPTLVAGGAPISGPEHPTASGFEHPNGAIGIDHVVIATPDFDRTAAALSDAALQLRRIRDGGGFRQGFRRLGPIILEVVEAPHETGHARFWGLVVITCDLDTLAQRLGERLGEVHPAVQPGRRIASLNDSAGLDEAVAFMDPDMR